MELKRSQNHIVRQVTKLLIVPYGIETSLQTAHPTNPRSTFNRTLWN